MNFNQRMARVFAHEANLKITGAPESESTRIVTREAWRSGGGCVPRSTERATLVRHVIDPNYEFFPATSRFGSLLD